jgi:nitrate reductase gamma subunit
MRKLCSCFNYHREATFEMHLMCSLKCYVIFVLFSNLPHVVSIFFTRPQANGFDCPSMFEIMS